MPKKKVKKLATVARGYVETVKVHPAPLKDLPPGIYHAGGSLDAKPGEGPQEKSKYRKKKCKDCIRGVKDGGICDTCKGAGYTWTRKKLKRRTAFRPDGVEVIPGVIVSGLPKKEE